MLDKKFDIQLTQIQGNSFQTMSASFGDSHDLESPGRYQKAEILQGKIILGVHPESGVHFVPGSGVKQFKFDDAIPTSRIR